MGISQRCQIKIKKHLETTSIDLTLRDEVVSEKPIKREVKSEISNKKLNRISNKKLNKREMEVIMFSLKKVHVSAEVSLNAGQNKADIRDVDRPQINILNPKKLHGNYRLKMRKRLLSSKMDKKQ